MSSAGPDLYGAMSPWRGRGVTAERMRLMLTPEAPLGVAANLTLVTLGQRDWIGRGSPFRHGINSIAGP